MATIDPFIDRALRYLKPFSKPRPKDPALRREQARDLGAISFAALGITAPDVATEDHTLAVPGHPDARLRVYWPTADRAEAGAGLPVFVHFFGGGFTLGGIDDPGWDATARRRAAEAGIIVVAGEYSHAPEVRFPAQPEQCWTVFDWAVRNVASIGGDAARIAIGGASSGGNLAAAVTLLNRERGKHPIRLQVLEAPALDLTMRSLETRGMRTGIPDAILRKLAGSLVRDYLGDSRALRRDPIASPMHSKRHRELPPAVIYTAELDPLRGDGEAYARKLLAAGVPTTAVRYLAQTHTSGGLLGWVPAADHLHRDVVSVLRSLHDEPADYDTRSPYPVIMEGDDAQGRDYHLVFRRDGRVAVELPDERSNKTSVEWWQGVEAVFETADEARAVIAQMIEARRETYEPLRNEGAPQG